MVLAAGLVMFVVFAGCSSQQGAIPGTMTLNELRMQIVMSMFQGDHDAVIKYCSRAIEIDPNQGEFSLNRASSLEAQKSYDAALEDYNEAIRIAPKDIMALTSRSKLYTLMGMPDQAALDDRAYAAVMTERNPHWPAEEAVRKLCGELDGFEPENYQKLSTREKSVWNVFWFNAEVMNGGIDQYFYNSAGDHAVDCLAALETIGATESVKLLKCGCTRFPNGTPHTDRETRQQQLDALLDGDERLDDKTEGEIDPQLFSLLLAYYNDVQASPAAQNENLGSSRRW